MFIYAFDYFCIYDIYKIYVIILSEKCNLYYDKDRVCTYKYTDLELKHESLIFVIGGYEQSET